MTKNPNRPGPVSSARIRSEILCGIVAVAALVGCRPLPPPTGGEVHGFVSADVGDQGRDKDRRRFGFVRLPGATVFLRDSGGTEVNRTVSDPHGWYMIPHTEPGTYQLCARKPGFVEGCRSATITIASETVHTPDELLIAAEKEAIWGRVELLDGRPCYRESTAFDSFFSARVELADLGGAAVAGPVMANGQGEYVLPRVPSAGDFRLRIECASDMDEQVVTLDAANFSGANPVDRTLANSSPRIDSLAATLGGAPVRMASPGDVLDVQVSAGDPDGDGLHYRWADSVGALASVDSPTVQWTLQAVPATNILFVEVQDGRGGVAFDRLTIKTATKGVRFNGRVSELAGAPPIPDAAVRVNGTATTTDAGGFFQIVTEESERYVLNASKPGYSFLSQIFHGGRNGLDLRLEQAQTVTFNPGEGTIVRDKRQRFEVRIDPGTLVDKDGNPVAGLVTGASYYYDPAAPNGIPGDYSALDSRNVDVTMDSFGAFGVDLADASGDPVNLAPDAAAAFSLNIPAAQVAAAPATIPLLLYDQRRGYWLQRGTAQRVGNAYVGRVTSFSQWNTDTVFQNAGCIKITVDEEKTRYPFKLRVTIPTGNGTDKIKVFPVTEKINGLFRLPPNANIKLEILPGSGPSSVLKTYNNVNSGNSVADPFPPFPFIACQGFDANPGTPVILALDLPTHTAMWLSRKGGVFLNGSPVPAQDQINEANAYYAAIGATGNANPADDKDTLTKWKSANGFPGGETQAWYFNGADLGFGREMHCRQTGGTDLACYVTNYGLVGGSAADALVDLLHDGNNDGVPDGQNPVATVAMETDGTQGAKFYVFNSAGTLAPQATLDGEGLKAVPHICLVCHGGNYNSNTHTVTGASFREFDVFSFAYDPVAFTLGNQQENLRKLNDFVKQTGPNSANGNNPIVKLIDGLYPGGVGVAGSTAQGTLHDDHLAAPFTDFVPVNWAGEEALYLTIPRRYCRACHISQASYIDWTEHAQFVSFATGNFSIENSVCNTYDMPHAEVPLKKFWFSTDPAAPAFLADGGTGLGFGSPCTP